MIIGLVRHGQTDWNAQGIIQGQTDIPLNEAGVQQAQSLANRLAEEAPIWNAVISSDLQRARRTASIIAEKLDIPVLAPDPRFRERDFGEVEGTTEAERLARWGSNWRECGPGIENTEALRARGREAVLELLHREKERNILIVSHGGFIAQLLQELCSGLEDMKLGNLSYSILQRDGEGWQSLLHNCTRHLDS
ncbi:histidine phosphatase family protein [Paenibacillus sp. PL2-23]|uniref:histidine phosphatase family protein n=1 Tax=Paenibacillus sp. PL2-23 TaxID=2100729 RepID=UPI0030FCCF86